MSGEPAPTEGEGGEKESEDPYFDDQFTRMMKESGLAEVVVKSSVREAHEVLASQDGENYNTIKDGVKFMAKMMPEDMYRRMADPKSGEYVKMYARVKAAMLESGHIKAGAKAPGTKAAAAPVVPGTKRQRGSTFRTSVGRKGEPQEKESTIWELPQKQMDALVRRTKGLE
jgi:hypothetical protein